MNNLILIDEIFADLNARLYDLAHYNHNFEINEVKKSLDYEELYLKKVEVGIFLFPIDIAISMIDSCIKRIEILQNKGFSLVEVITFYSKEKTPISDDEIEKIRELYHYEIENELSIYVHHLNEIKDYLLVNENKQPKNEKNVRSKVTKPLTYLSVPELSVLGMILNEYDTSGPKRIIPKYEVGEKKELFKLIADSVSSINRETISVGSINSNYYSSDNLEAVDFWKDKLLELHKGAMKLKQDMVKKQNKKR